MSDNEQSDNEQIQLSEAEEEVNETEVNTKVVKSKNSSLEIFDELENKITAMDSLSAVFIEKEKAFERDRKEYNTTWKKEHKELLNVFKKFTKVYKHDMAKSSKTRKTGNSGKGGFNKVTPVPKKLVEYLGLEEGTMMTRPQVTHLLNDKFKAEKFRSEENGKVIKITNKKAAKVLGCEMNHTIQFSEFQGFIKKFYEDEKEQTSNVTV